MAELTAEPSADAIADASTPALPSEAQVLAYLKQDPMLLSRHPQLLEHIELTHLSGTAVSLIERQVEVLRGKNGRLEARLERLADAAQDNEVRAEKTLRLAHALIRSPSLAAIAVGFRASMREDFDIDDVFIGINGTLLKRHDIDGIVPVDANGAIARAYDNFLRTRLIECGPITPERAALLFPKASVPILSAAVVPLEKEKHLGMIALGSREAERFQPRQGKLFLEMAAELIAAAIRSRMT